MGVDFFNADHCFEMNELTLAAMNGHFENKHLDKIVL